MARAPPPPPGPTSPAPFLYLSVPAITNHEKYDHVPLFPCCEPVTAYLVEREKVTSHKPVGVERPWRPRLVCCISCNVYPRKRVLGCL